MAFDYPIPDNRRDSPVHFNLPSYYSTVYGQPTSSYNIAITPTSTTTTTLNTTIPSSNTYQINSPIYNGYINKNIKNKKHSKLNSNNKKRNRRHQQQFSYPVSDFSVKNNNTCMKNQSGGSSSINKADDDYQPFNYPSQSIDTNTTRLFSNNSYIFSQIQPTSSSNDNLQSHTQTIRYHCLQFCQTTSLRGIPRIIKSSNPKQKFLWSFFVALFFIACLTCIGLLIVQYRAYDVIHQPKTLYNRTRSFPSLTLCNLRPITPEGYSYLKKHHILTPRDFEKHLKKSLIKMVGNLTLENRLLISTVFKFETFIMNLPKNINPTNIGHLIDDMIIDCFIVYKDNIFSISRRCDKAGKWVQIQHKLFHNCYTLTIDEEYSNRTMVIDLIAYLNNGQDLQCYDCYRSLAESQLSGAYLNLHSHETYPDTESEGLKVLPGTMTVIKFTPREWSMMEPPHGKCDKKVRQTISFDNRVFRYTEKACMMQLYQHELWNQCKCVDYHQVPTELLYAKQQGKICGYFHIPIEKFKNITLKMDVIKKYMDLTRCVLNISKSIGFDKCKSECTYFTYDTSNSFAQWPVKSYHTVYTKIIENKLIKRNNDQLNELSKKGLEKFKNNLKDYNRVIELEKNDPNKALKLLNKLDFIENNFLSVQVYRTNFDITLVEEKAVISLTSFLSQAGGLCSIWSGITFVCIVEIFELFIMIFESLYFKKNKHNNVK